MPSDLDRTAQYADIHADAATTPATVGTRAICPDRSVKRNTIRRNAYQATAGPADVPSTAAAPDVTGIGGVFLKVKDPKEMAAWYRTNLGIQSEGGYADFTWREKDHPEETGHTTWRIFPTNTTYFGESSSPLMSNYRVANTERMLE